MFFFTLIGNHDCQSKRSGGSIPRLATWISEIGYLPLPSCDMADIPLKRRKSSIQPTNQHNHVGRPGLLFADTFLSCPLQPLNIIQRHHVISFILFLGGGVGGSTGKRICPPQLLLAFPLLYNRWSKFNDTSQEVRSKLFYQVYVFRTNQKNKMAVLASDCLRHFDFPLKPLSGIQRNLAESLTSSHLHFYFLGGCRGSTGKRRWPPQPKHFHFPKTADRYSNETWQQERSQSPLPSFRFSDQSEKQVGSPGLWLSGAFFTFPLKLLSGIQLNSTGSKILCPSQSCFFSDRWEKESVTLASKWLSHFLHHLVNFSTDIKQSCREAKFQWLLQRLCFRGELENRWLQWLLICLDIFDISFETAKRN